MFIHREQFMNGTIIWKVVFYCENEQTVWEYMFVELKTMFSNLMIYQLANSFHDVLLFTILLDYKIPQWCFH